MVDVEHSLLVGQEKRARTDSRGESPVALLDPNVARSIQVVNRRRIGQPP